MKNIYLILICLLLISCSSTNIKKEVLRDFMQSDYVLSWNPKIIFQEAIITNKSLIRYETAFLDRNKSLSGEDPRRARPTGKPANPWPIDSLEIINMKNTIKNDTIPYLWSNKDFIEGKYDFFITEKLRNNPSYRDKYDGQRAFLLSKPIISSDKNYALISFSIAFSEYVYRGGGIPKVFLLKKENKKWVVENSYDWEFIYE